MLERAYVYKLQFSVFLLFFQMTYVAQLTLTPTKKFSSQLAVITASSKFYGAYWPEALIWPGSMHASNYLNWLV